MKTISKITFIMIVIISPLPAMEQGQASVDPQPKTIQSKTNYLKLSDGTHLTFLPEQTSTALQNNDSRTRAFVSVINIELKKKATK